MHNFTSIFSAADGVGIFFQNKVWKRLQMFSIYFLVKAMCNFTQLVKGHQPYGQYLLCRIDKKLFWLLKFMSAAVGHLECILHPAVFCFSVSVPRLASHTGVMAFLVCSTKGSRVKLIQFSNVFFRLIAMYLES